MRLCFDLHNHSCLSPCGSDDLLPSVLAMEAADKGIDILALTDHNSARNLGAFAEACEIVGIEPVFGIEITTIEEIHLLALFETLSAATEFGSWIESLLPPLHNNVRLFGHQLVSDVTGTVTEEVPLFLYGPAQLAFDDLVVRILSAGGLAVPAHIDRPVNSVIANLGFLPELPYSAVESIAMPPTVDTRNYTVTQGSDAHYLQHVGRRRCFLDSTFSGFAAVRDAFERGAVYSLGTTF